MPFFERHFSVEEARAELPRLRKELERLQLAFHGLEQTLAGAQSAGENSQSNGGSRGASHHFSHRERISELVSDIQGRGIQIKDPLRGLVDFPHLREGREVLLCWLLGEEDIEFWHDPETGFSGRRRL